jgi:RimJ/RimL family protein N-acetyltransferase
MEFQVRRIRADEGPAMRATRLRALADAPEAFGSEYGETSERPDSEWVERAERASAGGQQAMFVAEVGGEWQAMVLGHAPDGEQVACDLASMWVAPELRGSGASRELVEAVLAWAGESGFERVVLSVTEGNEAARRLYASCGFEFTGERELLRPHRAEVALEMVRVVEG